MRHLCLHCKSKGAAFEIILEFKRKVKFKANFYFFVFCSRTSLEDIEDEDEIEEYESEGETDKGKQVRTTIMLDKFSPHEETLR